MVTEVDSVTNNHGNEEEGKMERKDSTLCRQVNEGDVCIFLVAATFFP